MATNSRTHAVNLKLAQKHRFDSRHQGESYSRYLDQLLQTLLDLQRYPHGYRFSTHALTTVRTRLEDASNSSVSDQKSKIWRLWLQTATKAKMVLLMDLCSPPRSVFALEAPAHPLVHSDTFGGASHSSLPYSPADRSSRPSSATFYLPSHPSPINVRHKCTHPEFAEMLLDLNEFGHEWAIRTGFLEPFTLDCPPHILEAASKKSPSIEYESRPSSHGYLHSAPSYHHHQRPVHNDQGHRHEYYPEYRSATPRSATLTASPTQPPSTLYFPKSLWRTQSSRDAPSRIEKSITPPYRSRPHRRISIDSLLSHEEDASVSPSMPSRHYPSERSSYWPPLSPESGYLHKQDRTSVASS